MLQIIHLCLKALQNSEFNKLIALCGYMHFECGFALYFNFFKNPVVTPYEN